MRARAVERPFQNVTLRFGSLGTRTECAAGRGDFAGCLLFLKQITDLGAVQTVDRFQHRPHVIAAWKPQLLRQFDVQEEFPPAERKDLRN